MDEEVIGAQITMHYTSAVDVGHRLEGLSKPFLPQGEAYCIVLSIEKSLETAMASLSEEQSGRKLGLPTEASWGVESA